MYNPPSYIPYKAVYDNGYHDGLSLRPYWENKYGGSVKYWWLKGWIDSFSERMYVY